MPRAAPVPHADRFSSRWGLLLAGLGMAIGAGNIWRFPRVVSQHGGGAFMLVADLGLEETGRTGPAPSIELQVLKVMPDGRALPIVPADRPGESRRDLAYVARRPPSVRVLNGDSLRFRVSAGADGFVTLLNVGPTGTLSVLVPNPDLPELRVRSGVSVHFPPPEAGEIEVRPPEGPERIIAIWTRHRPGLAPEELYRRVMSGEAVPSDAETYCSTRQLVYVSRKLRDLDPADATWRLVEIDHKRA